MTEPLGGRLRAAWIKKNRTRFLKAKTEKQIFAALERAYDEAVYNQIVTEYTSQFANEDEALLALNSEMHS